MAVIYHGFVLFSILHYMIPAGILCALHRESRYERGWVEMFFLTWQTLWTLGERLFRLAVVALVCSLMLVLQPLSLCRRTYGTSGPNCYSHSQL